jgi:hypothetical protein
VRAAAAACRERLTVLRIDLDRLSQRQIGWLVFLATLCVYVFLTPHVVRNWWLTGDEPHYLLAAHSIVHDGDLKLANNYQQKDFLAFFVGDDLDPFLQAAPGADGDLYQIRPPGLSLLLAPAYLLGGRPGVLFFLDLVGALLAMNFYLLGYRVTHSALATLAAWVFVFFTPLLVLYNFLLYPEVVGALVLLLTLRLIVRTPDERPAHPARMRKWLLVGFLVASLPWLSSRFIPFAAILLSSALACAWRERYELPLRQATMCLLAPCVGSAILTLAYSRLLLGVASPLAAYGIGGHDVSSHFHRSFTDLAEGLVGFLLDPTRGLFIYAPVYLLSLPGILLFLRHERRQAFLLLLYPIIAYLYTAWTGLYFPGREISPKFMVSVMPILGIFMAYAFAAITRFSFRTIALGLLLFGITLTRLAIVVDPLAPYDKTVVASYNRWDRLDLNSLLPHFVPEFFASAHVGFGGVGTVTADDDLRDLLNALPPLFRVRVGQVLHTGPNPQDRGYAFVADLARDNYALVRGSYEAYWFLKIGDNASDNAVAIIDVLDPAGEVISSREIAASDFEHTGTYQRFTLPFDYPLQAADRGEPILRLFSTGREELWMAALEIRAVTPIPLWPLATLWLAGIGIFTALYGLRPGGEPLVASRPPSVAAGKRSILFPVASAILGLLIAASLANYLASIRYPRLFEAENLRRLTGQVGSDAQASGGKAVHAGPGDPEGELVYGPYEFFPPGPYVVKFRMKTGSVQSPVPVAHIDVFGSGSGVLTTVPILASDFKEEQRYRIFRLWFDNPMQQALQFRVYCFPTRAELWVDTIIVRKVQ